VVPTRYCPACRLPLGTVSSSRFGCSESQVQLDSSLLERLIDVRESDLDVNQYKTMADAVAYSEESASLLSTFSGMHRVDDEADIVASHAGIGIGLSRPYVRLPIGYSTAKYLFAELCTMQLTGWRI
jgi:hypothetical protein